METIAEKIYSVKEYFDLEAQSEVRREYVHGTLIEMPGASKIANKISLDFFQATLPLAEVYEGINISDDTLRK